MKHLFCINPSAGKRDRTPACREAIEAVFGARGVPYEIFISQGAGEITKRVRAAAETGEDLRVYACGGDGTLNEAVNGAACRPNAAVTHWPCGSGNDFIRLFDHPERFYDPKEFLDCETAAFDLVDVNGHFCIGVCSIGVDARIGTEIAKYKRLLLVNGPGAYAISTLVNVAKGVHQHYRILLDGELIDGRQTMVCICNGRWYGSGFNPVPEAMPDDGMLDVLLVRAVSRVQVARIIGRYKAGRYRELPDMITHYRCRRVQVLCDVENAINYDGELMRDRSVTFRIVDRAIRFFYPIGETWGQTEKAKAASAV